MGKGASLAGTPAARRRAGCTRRLLVCIGGCDPPYIKAGERVIRRNNVLRHSRLVDCAAGRCGGNGGADVLHEGDFCCRVALTLADLQGGFHRACVVHFSLMNE